MEEQSEERDTVILEQRSLQTSALNNHASKRTNDSGQAHQLKFAMRPQSGVPLSSRVYHNRQIPHTAYESMKSTNRGHFKEKQSHNDNYSTSISSANKAMARNNRHHDHRQLTSAKEKLRSSAKLDHKSHQGSPFRNNISMSSINVSEKFVNYIQDLGIPVNVRS